VAGEGVIQDHVRARSRALHGRAPAPRPPRDRPVIRHDTLKRAIEFRVIDRTADREVGAEQMRGVIHPDLTWEVKPPASAFLVSQADYN
jgi:hypothetical protein